MIAGHCPTGVTTQDPQRQKALVVPDKAEHVYRIKNNTLAALKKLVQAAGPTHPRQISASHIVRCTGEQEVKLPVGAARQSQLEAARDLKKLGVADTLHRAGATLPGLKPDTLLIDLHLEDGAGLSLVRTLRDGQADRPKVMLMAADASDPLLVATLRAGADAFSARI